jgi:hypothetical protein
MDWRFVARREVRVIVNLFVTSAVADSVPRRGRSGSDKLSAELRITRRTTGREVNRGPHNAGMFVELFLLG